MEVPGTLDPGFYRKLLKMDFILEQPWGIIAFAELILVVLSTYMLLPIYLKFSDTFYGAFYREMIEGTPIKFERNNFKFLLRKIGNLT